MTGRHLAATLAVTAAAILIAGAGLWEITLGHVATGGAGIAAASLGWIAARLLQLNFRLLADCSQLLAANSQLIDSNDVLSQQNLQLLLAADRYPEGRG